MSQKPHESGASAVRQALAAVRELKHVIEQQTSEPVAIVGAGCRVPGASSLEMFWELLLDKRDAIVPIPAARWRSDELYDADPLAEGKIATRWAGIIDAMAFDADFFGITAEEARQMDPQQRVFLEVAYEALEQAGLTGESLRGGRTGVFAGVVNYNDGYARRMFGDFKRINAFSGPGVSNSVLAGRLSYLFDLKGPSIAVDTACSSSLVAVHQACHSLRLRECELAIAGGVNIILGPEFSIATSRMHLMAPDGRCKPFDERADGIVRSDGCGVVILKRLSDAQRDNDTILAVIHASAVNQDGKTNGITAPSGHSQEDLLRMVLAQARLGPDDLGYIEAHGTGTKLGDPIEVAALDRALASRSNPQPCRVGSVKANIGHCEAAAGIVSLIKVALCLRQRCIPGQAHLETLNRHMEFDAGRIDFPREAMPWPEMDGRPQYAAVSSFGWSGTNAQVLLGPAPATPLGGDAPSSGGGLALVFSGQGTQWPGMVDALLVDEPAFRESMDNCEAIIQKIAGWSLLEAIAGHSDTDLSRTELAQPCIVAIQVSLFAMLTAWGAKPTAVMGHSVGEFSAACCAGMLDLEEMLRAVIHRGRCMEALRDRGRMYAALAPDHVVRELLGGWPEATISAVNGPTATIISVTAESAGALKEKCAAASLELIPVNPHYPFHCPLIEPLADELRQGFSHLRHRPPALAFVSSSRGLPVQNETLDVSYWVDNALRPVHFEQAIVNLAGLGCDTFVEIGPHASLIQHIKSSLAQRHPAVRVMGTLNKNRASALCVEQLKTALFAAGRHRTSATFGPRHQWRHCEYDLPPLTASAPADTGRLMGERGKGLSRLALRTQWGAGQSPLLGDHCMFDKVVVPGAAHLCVLLSHGIQDLGMRQPRLSDAWFIRPLLMAREDTSLVSIELTRQPGPRSAFDCHIHAGREGGQPVSLSSGTLAEARDALADTDMSRLQSAIEDAFELDVHAFYAKARAAGLQLGPLFRKIRRFWLSRDKRSMFLSLESSSPEVRREGLVLDPGVLDSCFQALFAAYWQQLPDADLFIPLSVDRFTLARPPAGPLWGVIELTSQSIDLTTEVLSGDIHLFDGQGCGVADLGHVQLKRARRAALLGGANEAAGQLFQLSWRAIKDGHRPLAGTQSFVVVGQAPYAGELSAALERLGHRTAMYAKAQDVREPADHALYLAPDRDGPPETWTERIAADIDQLRLLAELQGRQDFGRHLCVLTRGVYPFGIDAPANALVGGATAAVMRVIAKEYPIIDCTTRDLSAIPDERIAGVETAARVLAGDYPEPVLRIAGDEILEPEAQRLTGDAQATLRIDAQGHYLIIGGFGETGQALLRQLVALGARSVTLMGRSPPSEEVMAQAAHFKETGIHVQLFQGDIGVFEDAAALIRTAARSGRPLKGIYHLAGVVEDSTLVRLDPAALRRVLNPKVMGAWHLHQATEGMPLDWFIAFSSLSASIGIAGQSAYVAANAFLEGLMRRRRQSGLPGAAIGWGPWSAGMSARLAPAHLERLRDMGLGLLSVDQVAAIALRADVAASAAVIAADVSLHVLRGLLRRQATPRPDNEEDLAREERGITALDEAGKREAMTRLLMDELAPVAGQTALTPDTEMAEIGMDSLTAVAIVQRIRRRTGQTPPVSAFFDSPRLRDVVEKLLNNV